MVIHVRKIGTLWPGGQVWTRPHNPNNLLTMDEHELAIVHARDLLSRLGCFERPTGRGEHPALGWRRAGLMKITGRAETDTSGLVVPSALTSAADGALMALKTLAPKVILPACGAMLLGERARLLGLERRGSISPNGSCRLLAARDGRIAINLPRTDDWELLPALLGEAVSDWGRLADLVALHERKLLVCRGRMLGLAMAVDEHPTFASPFECRQLGKPRSRHKAPLVIDLSSLWAGPLAASLLAMMGANVVKVESRDRPDGTRRGNSLAYGLLNTRKESVALDFNDPVDLERLKRLVNVADIVIESSRPRALKQLGIDAEAVVRAGATWVSITAYGRWGDAENWAGFGDDAGVAAGLATEMARVWGESLFAGDAIADPVTGINGALAAWAGWRSGGGCMITLALAHVMAHAIALHQVDDIEEWQALAETDDAPLYPLRAVSGPVRALGADTHSVLARYGIG